jgi:hypothetical protein
MNLLLSDDSYPAGDPNHLLEWPWKYRKWICERDSTHWANVSSEEWLAVEQFARERVAENTPLEIPHTHVPFFFLGQSRSRQGAVISALTSLLLLPVLVLALALSLPILLSVVLFRLFRWCKRIALRG